MEVHLETIVESAMSRSSLGRQLFKLFTTEQPRYTVHPRWGLERYVQSIFGEELTLPSISQARPSSPSPRARMSYQEQYSLERRTMESNRLIQSNPGYIPVIVEKIEACSANTCRKYIICGDRTVGEFIQLIRKRASLEQDETIFLSARDAVLTDDSAPMSQIFDDFKDSDGFLYINFSTRSARRRSSRIFDYTQDNMCIICFDAGVDATFTHGDTGHRACCGACASRIFAAEQPCPVCRQPIDGLVHNTPIIAGDFIEEDDELLELPLSKGDHVLVIDLMCATQHNGKRGLLSDFESSEQRWVVLLEGEETPFLVKPENLLRVSCNKERDRFKERCSSDVSAADTVLNSPRSPGSRSSSPSGTSSTSSNQ
jgi:GABA(A) receptor-associated protein